MPIFEEGIKTLILHKELITEKNKLVFLPSWDAFNRANHKESLAKHLDEHNIPGPRSMLLTSTDALVFDTLTINFPLLAKPPENTGGGDGIRKFDTKQELKNYFKGAVLGQPLLLQEFIEGYDLGCNVLCKEGEILAFTIQKGNMWNQKPFSPQIGLRFIEDHEAYQTVERLMKSLCWTGVANVDMRYDSKNKEFKIIEINPRFWGTLDASLIAGVNFPHLLCRSALGEEYGVPAYEQVAYLNLKGLIQCLLKNRSYIPNVAFIWNNTPLKYAVKDPVPMVYWFFWRTKNILVRRLKFTKQTA
jgi:predicted ATP-grasp superfamily ATP-dependent carboligase